MPPVLQVAHAGQQIQILHMLAENSLGSNPFGAVCPLHPSSFLTPSQTHAHVCECSTKGPVCTELHYADHCQQFIAEFSSMPLWIDFFSVPYFRKCCGHFFVPPVSGVKGTTSAQASQEFLWRCQFPISWKSFSGVPMLLELYLMHVIDIFGLGRNESLVLITIPSLPWEHLD